MIASIDGEAALDLYLRLVAELNSMRSQNARVELQLPLMQDLTEVCFRLSLLGKRPWKDPTYPRADAPHAARRAQLRRELDARSRQPRRPAGPIGRPRGLQA